MNFSGSYIRTSFDEFLVATFHIRIQQPGGRDATLQVIFSKAELKSTCRSIVYFLSWMIVSLKKLKTNLSS